MTAARWRRPGALYLQSGVRSERVFPLLNTRDPSAPPVAPEDVVPRWAHAPVLPWTYGGVPLPTGNTVADDRNVMARGWPCLALFCSFTNVNLRSTPPYHDVAIGGGIRVPIPAHTTPAYTEPAPPVALPLAPIWCGLVINTAAYASAWSVLLFLPPAIRGGLRRHRGHCPRCGYDLGYDFSLPGVRRGRPGSGLPGGGWQRPDAPTRTGNARPKPRKPAILCRLLPSG